MKRLSLLSLCFVITFATMSSPVSAQGNIDWEELWKELPPRGHIHLPMSWMNDSLAFTGFAYDQTRDVIYVVSPRFTRSGGMLLAEPRIYILDADSGKLRMDLGRSAFPGTLGQGGEVPVPLDTIAFGQQFGFARNRFALYKIDVDEEGRIYACNLVNPIWDFCKTGGPVITGCDPDYKDQGPFRVWRWDTPTSTPELIYATLNTNADAIGDKNSSEMAYARWGDAFAVTGKRGMYYPPGPGAPVMHDSVRIYVSGGSWPSHTANNTVAVLVEDRRPYAQRPNRDTFGGGKLSFRLGVNLIQPLAGAASHGIAPEGDTLFHGHFTREIWMSGNTNPVTRSTELQSSIMPIPQNYQPPPQNILSLSSNLTGAAGPVESVKFPEFQRRFLITADGLPSNISNPQLPNTNTTARFLDVTAPGAEFQALGATPGIDSRILETIDDNNYVADVEYKIHYFDPGGAPIATRARLILYLLMSNNGIACYASRSSWPVPVELAAFSATWVNDAVQLRWQVESETNALLFRVERAIEKEGPWNAAGSVPARGTTTEAFTYGFTDNNPPVTERGDALWYRLVEIDMDGKRTEFPAVQVLRQSAPHAHSLRVFPQPLSEGAQSMQLYCESPRSQEVTLNVRDLLGRRMIDPVQREVTAGATILTLQRLRLRSGIYFVSAAFSDGTHRLRRVLVQ